MKMMVNFFQHRSKFLYLLLIFNSYIAFNHIRSKEFNFSSLTSSRAGDNSNSNESSVQNNEPIQSHAIFVGGYPRSGTTLMRAILDVHPAVNCGPETRILPMFLEFIHKSMSDRTLVRDMNERYYENATIDKATSLFIHHIINNRNFERPCAKDPKTLLYMSHLHQLFPNSRFVYMVRDARGAVYSLLAKTPISKRELSMKIKETLIDWNTLNHEMYTQCSELGESVCKVVKYEDLVENAEITLKDLVRFLNLTWSNDLLNHEKFIGKKVLVSDLEWSTDNIKKKINKKSLRLWSGKMKFDKAFVASLSMQKKFGYV